MNESTSPPWNDSPWASTFQVRTTRMRSPTPRPATPAILVVLSPGSGTTIGSGVALRRIDVVGLELPVEVAALDPQALGGAGHVPVVGAQLGEDVRALEVVARVLERPIAGFAHRRRGFLGSQRRRQVLGGDHVARRHDDEPLDHVAELAHIAGPVVGQEVPERFGREGLRALAVLGAELRDEVAHVGGDIVLAGPQRRDLDRDHVQAVVEVFAELPLADQGRQIAVGRGDHPYVYPERVLAADPLERLLLERAQDFRLGLEAHVADLVQEERAAVGELELATTPRQRAGEGPLLVAEQLGLDQLLGDGRAIDLDEGALAARRLHVDGPRHQLLAAAVLAVDQHAAGGGRGGRDLVAERADRGALADDLGALLEARAQGRVLALEPRVLEGPTDRDQDLLERQRLLDEIVGAQARRLDGRLDRAVARDHDHDRSGRARLISARVSRPSIRPIQMSRKVTSGSSSAKKRSASAPPPTAETR